MSLIVRNLNKIPPLAWVWALLLQSQVSVGKKSFNVSTKKTVSSMHIVCDSLGLSVLTSFNLRDLLLGCRQREQTG